MSQLPPPPRPLNPEKVTNCGELTFGPANFGPSGPEDGQSNTPQRIFRAINPPPSENFTETEAKLKTYSPYYVKFEILLKALNLLDLLN